MPVDDKILDSLRNETKNYRDVFSIGHPLKSLYALHAVREHLGSLCPSVESPKEDSLYSDALRRVLGLIASAIRDRDIIDNGSGADLKAALATRLVDQFHTILRGSLPQRLGEHSLVRMLTLLDPMRPGSTDNYLDGALMGRLFEMLCSSLAAEPTSFTTNLVTVTFRAIIHLCSLRQDLWERLRSQTKLKEIVQRLLIDDTRGIVRKSAATTIGEKTAYSLRYELSATLRSSQC